MYANMCWQHTKSRRQLQIKDSRIAGAGKGLFTTKDLKNADKIGEYKGENYPESKDNPISDYGFAVGKKKKNKQRMVIDAASTQSCLARYINDYRGTGKERNVRFRYINNSRTRVEVVAKGDIPAGTELLISYGKEFNASKDKKAAALKRAEGLISARARNKGKRKGGRRKRARSPTY